MYKQATLIAAPPPTSDAIEGRWLGVAVASFVA